MFNKILSGNIFTGKTVADGIIFATTLLPVPPEKPEPMKIKWRKWNRAIHRDLGYFFAAVSVIYALSGLAINHLGDWNPNYIINTKEFKVDVEKELTPVTKEKVLQLLDKYGEKDHYKKYYLKKSGKMKIFLEGGDVLINMNTGEGVIEKIHRRPVFHAVNYLHYNPGRWWVWFSDAFCIALILLAVTGLFILRGKNGIKGRGAVLTIAGILIPVIYLILFYR